MGHRTRRFRGRHAAPAVLALALVFAVAGCTAPGDDNQGGGPIPQQFDGESYPGARREIVGTLRVSGSGCFLLDALGQRLLAVWPKGTQSLGDKVRLPDGRVLADGAGVDAMGLRFPTADLVGIVDGYWGSQVNFCTPEAEHVVVIDDIR